MITEDLEDFLSHLFGKNRPAVEHGDQNSEHPQLSIRPRLDFVDCLEKIVRTLEREVRGLDRRRTELSIGQRGHRCRRRWHVRPVRSRRQGDGSDSDHQYRLPLELQRSLADTAPPGAFRAQDRRFFRQARESTTN